jgi:hypothetical protein
VATAAFAAATDGGMGGGGVDDTGVAAGADTTAARDAPHSPQNIAFGRTARPQFGQFTSGCLSLARSTTPASYRAVFSKIPKNDFTYRVQTG